MIRRVLLAGQSLVGPAIQIRVFATQEAIAREPDGAHALEQHLRCQAQVQTVSVLVAGVCVVFAGIVRFAHLWPEQKEYKVIHDRSWVGVGWGVGVNIVIQREKLVPACFRGLPAVRGHTAGCLYSGEDRACSSTPGLCLHTL